MFLRNEICLIIRTTALIGFMVLMNSTTDYSQTPYPQPYPQPQQPIFYPQQPYGTNGYENNYDNYSTNSPFKTEVAKVEASVYRSGKEPLPLMEVPRLNQGDVLKVKIANESVNGIMPHQTNWDWTLLVAFINPSRNNDRDTTLSEEIRLKEKGWYNDYFFTVPYDSQPIIFLYPKSNYRKKILDLIQKKPDEVRKMGEKVIEISGAYGQISSFLNQVQYLMSKPVNNYNAYGNNNFVAGNGYDVSPGANDVYIEQSIEGLARSFNIQLPNCWNQLAYSGNMAMRAQCVARNIRLEDLNFSVSQMLMQGGLIALNKLRMNYPELSKWIAIAAIAIDFILKLAGKTALRIIPAVVSSPNNPLYFQDNSYQNGYQNFQPSPQSTIQNNIVTSNNQVSLYANIQPNDREFVTVYAFVPHKWQANTDPDVFKIYAPRMNEPCLHTGNNILRNVDLRLEWLLDTFTRDFKLVLADQNGWRKEFSLRKNLALNGWEVDIPKGELEVLPQTSISFDAKITGRRGFNVIESPTFSLPISNSGKWEATITPLANRKSSVTLHKLSGDVQCSQNIIYNPSMGQSIIFPIVRNNNLLKISPDGNIIFFELEGITSENVTEKLKIQQIGGDLIPVTIKP